MHEALTTPSTNNAKYTTNHMISTLRGVPLYFTRRIVWPPLPTFAPTAREYVASGGGGNVGRSELNNDGQLQKVLLKRNRQLRAFREGNQLVFSGSVAQVPGSVKIGQLVRVEAPAGNDATTENSTLIGWGVYNPKSMYRVRILEHSIQRPASDDSRDEKSCLTDILSRQFRKALRLRQAMHLPSLDTNTYRLLNGEGDGLSGLSIDIVAGRIAVVMSSAAWCEIHKSVILDCLQKVLPNHELVWMIAPSRLRQDGYDLLREPEPRGEETDVGAPVIGLENGIKYQIDPNQKGQKTSVYCDQRENRYNLGQMCNGKRVLDLCCYHGGFALNAALGQASRVVGVDSSAAAIETCRENSKLNSLEATTEFVRSDVSDFMKSCKDRFDVVILDPPKLAPNAKTLKKASGKYQSLNRDALKLFDDAGGLLLTCTCSAAMTEEDGGKFFLQMVQRASVAARREVTLVRVGGAACCHTQSPASFPAGKYLTAALFFVHPK